MSKPFDPDWTVHPSAHLREFVEQWQTAPGRALACASQGVITAERAQQMLDGEGDPWTLIEASVVSFAMGPTPSFWTNLLDNHRRAVAVGKTVVDQHPWKPRRRR